jgi:hypothetical protein
MSRCTMKRIRDVLLLGAVFAVSQGGFCGGGAPPRPDQCSGPMLRGPIDSVELGVLESGEPADFKSIADGDTLQIVFGPQGGSMVAVALRVTGDDPPSCLQQKTRVAYRAGGSSLEDSVTVPLTTYPTGDRVRTTRISWVIFDAYPEAGAATITVEAAGQKITRSVMLAR